PLAVAVLLFGPAAGELLEMLVQILGLPLELVLLGLLLAGLARGLVLAGFGGALGPVVGRGGVGRLAQLLEEAVERLVRRGGLAGLLGGVALLLVARGGGRLGVIELLEEAVECLVAGLLALLRQAERGEEDGAAERRRQREGLQLGHGHSSPSSCLGL